MTISNHKKFREICSSELFRWVFIFSFLHFNHNVQLFKYHIFHCTMILVQDKQNLWNKLIKISSFKHAISVSSGGATHKGGGPRPPQSFKKLFYSIYIIYILKNIAYKNWSWSPKFWVISMVLLKEREIILKSYI